jgi:LysM repeat protein
MDTYTVKAGDTLARIAAAIYGRSSYFDRLAAFNDIPDPNRIRVGQVLRTPPLAVLEGAIAPPPPPEPEPAPAAASTGLSPKHFDVQRRRDYVSFILESPDRTNFLKPATQTWEGGKWLHAFSESGKTFRVGADWGAAKRGDLVIVSPTAAGKDFTTPRATFCNFNITFCYHRAYGGPSLQFLGGKERSANELIDMLRRDWKEVPAAQAAKIANAGGFVVAGKKASPNGHVVFLLEKSDERGDPAGIRTFHVGSGVPRVRTIANIWGSGSGSVTYVVPPEAFLAWTADGG